MQHKATLEYTIVAAEDSWWYFTTADHYIPNLFVAFFQFLDKAILLSLTTFPFILNVLKYLRIAFIQKVETF